MKKRLISMLLSAVILFACFAPAALADGVCGESVSWTLSDTGVLTISGDGDMATSRPAPLHGTHSATKCAGLSLKAE